MGSLQSQLQQVQLERSSLQSKLKASQAEIASLQQVRQWYQQQLALAQEARVRLQGEMANMQVRAGRSRSSIQVNGSRVYSRDAEDTDGGRSVSLVVRRRGK